MWVDGRSPQLHYIVSIWLGLIVAHGVIHSDQGELTHLTSSQPTHVVAVQQTGVRFVWDVVGLFTLTTKSFTKISITSPSTGSAHNKSVPHDQQSPKWMKMSFTHDRSESLIAAWNRS